MIFVRFMINLFREVLRMKTFFDHLKLSKFKQEMLREDFYFFQKSTFTIVCIIFLIQLGSGTRFQE